MIMFGIILLIISAILLLGAITFYVLYQIFEYKPNKIGQTTAILKETKHKKNVPIYGQNSSRAPLRVVMIIENWSKSIYTYTVNGKNYKIHYVEYVTARQMPWCVQIVYLKKIPKIAYVKTDTNFHNFEIYSFAALMFAILSAVWGLSVIF